MEFRINSFPDLSWMSICTILQEDHFTLLSSQLPATFIFILLNVGSLSVTCPQNSPSDIGLLQLLISIGTVHVEEEWGHRLPGQYPGGQDDMALATGYI